MTRNRLLAAGAAAVVLLLAACGSNDAGSQTSAATSATSAAAASTPATSVQSSSAETSATDSPAAESSPESSADGSSSSAESSSSGGSGGAPTCEASQVGVFTRCANFYTDYWPAIDKHLDELYEQAKQADGGKLVIWDWYELGPDVIAQFNKRFPDIKIETKGLTYNLSSAIIAAKSTGARNTDVVSGSITSMTDMYDAGFWDKVDWTTLGVPKEFLTIGAPELMPDSVNGALLQYNTSKVPSVPDNLDGLTAPDYKGKISVANYNAGVFSGYGMKNGKDKMVELIKNLKSSGNMQVVDDTSTPLSSGDIPIAINQTLFNPNPDLKVSAFDATNVFAQFSGVNVDAQNKAGAELWVLWNAFDPDWLHERMTNEKFATSQVPFAGLPESVFAQATGLAKTNTDAVIGALTDGIAETETQATRDQWNEMINAADDALNN
jgi:ABC-type Fe3+ transport system substrate-binding protein